MTAVFKPQVATNPWMPHLVTIRDIRKELTGTSTYELEFDDPEVRAQYRFLPGQFNMLYLPGIGEAAISISSDPERHQTLYHTVRVAGGVTQALAHRHVGDHIALRGPFGSAWPMEAARGKDVVVACGGIGLAPLRPAIHHMINHRDDYGNVDLLYGARSPRDLLYTDQFDAWRDAGINVTVTVDIGNDQWRGNIGVVPVLFYHLRIDPATTCVLTCGPEIMMRFVVFEALARKLSADDIYVSMERNMSCALGLCGHCQLGPKFVCKDGPVFTYRQMEPYMHIDDF
ncbi:MAG: FAD/NAD(P)-binding protein [Pirellulales bacterium]